jgi:zinc/manganese transport system permease protein
MAAVAGIVALGSGFLGLLLSYHAGAPAGPAIVLMAGFAYFVSVVAGPAGGLAHRLRRPRHLQA